LEKEKLKVALVSSTGGHFSELLQLVPGVEDFKYFIVTEENSTSGSIGEKHPVHFLKQQERKDFFFFNVFLNNIYRSFRILMKEKPDVIISTGAGATVPICLLGKLLRKRIIFIESFAKVNSPTMTGRIVYRFSDKFYIQWQELEKFYPKAEYRGKIY
jgi:beta-1,4-N-acetylglucosaminyltransferase